MADNEPVDQSGAAVSVRDPQRIDASGRFLVVEAHGVRVEVGSVAAVLRSVVIDGVQVTEPNDGAAQPVWGSGMVLAPWPNRVRDGRWILDGVVQQLDLTEPAGGNAIHGLLCNVEYTVRDVGPSSITLGALVPPQNGWPFLLDTWVRYEVGAHQLTATHGATNLGTRTAPWAVGGHPYLRMGDASVDDLVLTVPADTYYEIDARKLPIAELPVEGTVHDARAGIRVGDLTHDDAFGAIAHRDGASAWLTAPDGAVLELLQDADWGCVQVFAPPDYPRPQGAGCAITIEPMSAPADALNSGQGLQWLEPGESSEGSWGLRYRSNA